MRRFTVLTSTAKTPVSRFASLGLRCSYGSRASRRLLRTTAGPAALGASSERVVYWGALLGGVTLALATSRVSIHAATVPDDGDSVREERSGFLFPKRVRFDATTEGQVLAVGVRKMYVIFTTYAIGLYANPKDVRTALAGYKDLPPEEMKKSQAVYDALRDGSFTKMIRLIPTSDTSGSHLRNGLVSAVAARMKEQKEEALKQFGNFFPNQLKKGMIIDFVWKKGGDLVVSVDGEEVGVVASPALAQAFFEVYLGEKTKTPDVREKWALSISEWLRSQEL